MAAVMTQQEAQTEMSRILGRLAGGLLTSSQAITELEPLILPAQSPTGASTLVGNVMGQLGAQAPAAAQAPAPAGFFGAPQQQFADPLADPDVESFGRQSAFLARFGLAGDVTSPAQRWQRTFFNPLENIFAMRNLMQPALGAGTVAPKWSDFLPGQASGAYTLGAQTLQQLFGMTPGQRELAGIDFQNLPGTTGGAPGGASVSDFANLLQTGLRGTMGRIGAGFISRQVPQAQTLWGARQIGMPEGERGGSFVDWFRSRYNLGSFGV